MSAIAGILSRTGTNIDLEILDRLRDALGHPSADNKCCHVKGAVGFIQSRMASLDLLSDEQQLLYQDNANASAVIADGRIYNDAELRRSLGDDTCKTGSDKDVILGLYARDGVIGFDRLRGMYGFAIHDAQSNHVVLCRDPFGIKPLYYVETPDCFAFSSEPKALIEAGLVSRTARGDARAELLQLQFTTGSDMIIDGIKRVLPGESIVLNNGRIIERHRRHVFDDHGAVGTQLEDALQQWDRIFEQSVRIHQGEKADCAIFLSGGVDSASLLGMMHRLNERPVTAYTAVFSQSDGDDECALARDVAQACNAKHVEVQFSEDDFWAFLPEVAACMADPVADYAILPAYKLAREAARDFDVVLTGEGGDELFGGYGRYRSVMRPLLLGGRVMRSKGVFDKLDVLVPGVLDGWRDGIAASESRENRGQRSRLAIAQAVDCSDWLPNDLLIKLDRTFAAQGIEGRTPFLDPMVAEFAYHLPDRLKIHKHTGKYLLRRWLDRCLPMAQPFAKKRSAAFPVSDWIKGKGPRLGPLVANQAGIREIAKPGQVEKLFMSDGKKEGMACWHLLFYALWHQQMILDTPYSGDVFETLAV
ncbi:asparagine synthase (glutamine-hydrolyzing) [Thalassospira sp. MA62]|nr:asparagine synthase (glutamine-hydrolyzing) [Thalassospira sp. MA62]